MKWIGGASVLLMMFLISSCTTDKGGGPKPEPGMLMVKVDNAAWVAYQDGEDGWTFLTENPNPEAASLRGLNRRAADGRAERMGRQAARPRADEVEALFREREQQGGLTLLSEHTVTINDPQGRYGVASVCEDPETGATYLDIEHATLSENDEVFVGCFFGNDKTPTFSVSGSVSGLDAAAFAYLGMGYRSERVDALEPTYSFALEQDFYDLVATRYSDASVPTKMLVTANIALGVDRVIDVDFNAAEAFVPELRSLSVAGAASEDSLFGHVAARTFNDTFATVGSIEDTASVQYALLPENYLSQDGLYEAFVYVYSDHDDGTSDYRSVYERFLPSASKTIALPTPFGDASVTREAGGSYLHPSAAWAPYAGENVRYVQNYSQPDSSNDNYYYVTQSSGWFGEAATELRYTLPDLGGLKGWQQGWGLSSELETFWNVEAGARRGSFDEDGYRSTWAGKQGSLP